MYEQGSTVLTMLKSCYESVMVAQKKKKKENCFDDLVNNKTDYTMFTRWSLKMSCMLLVPRKFDWHPSGACLGLGLVFSKTEALGRNKCWSHCNAGRCMGYSGCRHFRHSPGHSLCTGRIVSEVVGCLGRTVGMQEALPFQHVYVHQTPEFWQHIVSVASVFSCIHHKWVIIMYAM